jgi:hypothetical protein
MRLVDELLAEHRRTRLSPADLDARLRELANGAEPEARSQAADMLSRWDEFRELGQPTERRDPYTPSE